VTGKPLLSLESTKNKIIQTNTDTISRTLFRRRKMEDFGWLLKNKYVMTKNDLVAILCSEERTEHFCNRLVHELRRQDDFSETGAMDTLELMNVLLDLVPEDCKWRWKFIDFLVPIGIVEALLIKLENVASVPLQRRVLDLLASLSDHSEVPRRLFHPENFGMTVKVKPLLNLLLLLRGNPRDEGILSSITYILFQYSLFCPRNASRMMIETPYCLELLEWVAYHGNERFPDTWIGPTVNEIFKRLISHMYVSMQAVKNAKECEELISLKITL
jgi:hypothetical protein